MITLTIKFTTKEDDVLRQASNFLSHRRIGRLYFGGLPLIGCQTRKESRGKSIDINAFGVNAMLLQVLNERRATFDAVEHNKNGA